MKKNSRNRIRILSSKVPRIRTKRNGLGTLAESFSYLQAIQHCEKCNVLTVMYGINFIILYFTK